MVSIIDDIRVLGVQVLDLGKILKKSKTQTVLAFVADGQVGENKVAGRCWAVEVGHACNRGTGENGEARAAGGGRASGGDGAGILEAGVKEEVCIVGKRDFLVVFEDAEFDNGRRVDRASVGTRLCAATTGAGALGLLDYLQVVADLPAILCCADGLALCLVGDNNVGHDGGGGGVGVGWVAVASQHGAWLCVRAWSWSWNEWVAGTATLQAAGKGNGTYAGNHTMGPLIA